MGWQAPEVAPAAARTLAARLGLHPAMGLVLHGRGLTDLARARGYLRPTEMPPPDPWQMPGVKTAAWRILQAVRRQEPTVVYGDYDVDGQTATAILLRVLEALGAKVQPFIPHRLSLGYGLHESVLLEMAERGVRLVVAVDCGITSEQPIRAAAAAGLEVVVVDHHEPPRRLPPAAALVCAHRQHHTPGGEDLAAAGLAFHLGRALWELGGMAPVPVTTWVQLAALGTVADVVPLVGENRRIVQLGLDAMHRAPVPGIAALCRTASIDPASLTARRIAFILAPRLNAAGRVDDPTVGLRLLLARSLDEAMPLAERLEATNRLRQQTEQDVLQAALEQAEARRQEGDMPGLVVAGEGWHPGVIGIVASRLVARYGRPAAVISLEEGMGRGSARSVAGVDLYAVMAQACLPWLQHFGGHPMAAGFSLAAADVAAFRQAFEQGLQAAYPEGPPSVVRLDGWVSLESVDAELCRQLELLEPLGEANPATVLGCAGVEVLQARPVGVEGQHVRFVVREPASGHEVGAIAFGQAEAFRPFLEAHAPVGRVDLAFTPQLGRFGDVELKVTAWRPASEVTPTAAGVLAVTGASEPPDPVAVRVVAQSIGATPLAPEAPGAPAPLAVVDRRGLADGGEAAFIQWLQEVAPARWVALVRGVGRAVQLCGAVWAVRPELGGRVAWTLPGGSGMSEPWGDDGLFDGVTGVVAGAGWQRAAEGLMGRRRFSTILIWELPDPLELAALLATAAQDPERPVPVILAYGETERRAVQAYLDATLPDADGLRTLYRLLHAYVRLGGPFLGDSALRLARQLAGLQLEVTGPLALSAVGVAHGLWVFAELGLVERGPSGWTWRGPRSSGKLDLTQSARYNDLTRTRTRWSEYVARAYDGDPHSLVNGWNRWAQGA